MAQILEPPPPLQDFPRVSKWLNQVWEKITQSLASGNSAGGDLTGTYPDPTIDSLKGVTLPTLAASNFLQVNAGATAFDNVPFGSSAGEICEADDARLSDSRDPNAHKTSHQNGGSDEISVAGLSGLLADDQNPVAHASDHENGGGDEINVGGLSGLLADNQNPVDHASDHEASGSDEIDLNGMKWTGAAGQQVVYQWAEETLSSLSGASASTSGLVPAEAFDIIILIEVTADITGPTDMDVGDGAGDVDRFGAGIALTDGTKTSPSDYTAAWDRFAYAAAGLDVTLTPNGGNFSDGQVVVSAFYGLATN